MATVGLVIRIVLVAVICMWVGVAGFGQTYHELTAHRYRDAAGLAALHGALLVFILVQFRKYIRFKRESWRERN